jgi:hypothetical protein
VACLDVCIGVCRSIDNGSVRSRLDGVQLILKEPAALSPMSRLMENDPRRPSPKQPHAGASLGHGRRRLEEAALVWPSRRQRHDCARLGSRCRDGSKQDGSTDTHRPLKNFRVDCTDEGVCFWRPNLLWSHHDVLETRRTPRRRTQRGWSRYCYSPSRSEFKQGGYIG